MHLKYNKNAYIFQSPPTPLLLLAKVLAEAKLNKTINLMYTWPHVYTLPYIYISHVCFISSLLCAHAACAWGSFQFIVVTADICLTVYTHDHALLYIYTL